MAPPDPEAGVVVLLAGCVAPYSYAAQNRMLPLAPPTRFHFFDEAGRFHWRPFVYGIAPSAHEPGEDEEDRTRRYPLRLFVSGEDGTIAGMIPTRFHLFGVEEPGRIFLLGTDEYGRDQFSRLVHGGQLSLLAGLLAAAWYGGDGVNYAYGSHPYWDVWLPPMDESRRVNVQDCTRPIADSGANLRCR